MSSKSGNLGNWFARKTIGEQIRNRNSQKEESANLLKKSKNQKTKKSKQK